MSKELLSSLTKELKKLKQYRNPIGEAPYDWDPKTHAVTDKNGRLVAFIGPTAMKAFRKLSKDAKK